MSDNWIRIIPTEPSFVPTLSAGYEALGLLAVFAPVALNDEGAREIRESEIVFVDAGTNFTALSCPSCGNELDLGWWQQHMENAAQSSYIDLVIQTPCCKGATSLNDLRYDWPQGFALWQLEVMNPLIGELTNNQLNAIAQRVGHEVRAIYVHL
jgi:hypothetical protein